jgi:hypothetical protein
MTKSDFPYEIVDVIDVEPRGGHRLFVRFSNGTEGEHDFGPFIEEGGEMVEPLRDPSYFARVFLDDGVPAWPNGFDIDAIKLHSDMAASGELRRDAAE